jgi:hypothetical protein
LVLDRARVEGAVVALAYPACIVKRAEVRSQPHSAKGDAARRRIQ